MQESVFVQNEFDFTFEDGYDTDDVPTLPAEKEQTYQSLLQTIEHIAGKLVNES